ncbi:00dc3048-6137-44bc-8c70-daa6954f1df9 [Thermothielavioides terrestris]|uniref:00dc3048-6137-44bc-8c70-daa6954f1df9 n=1 Tax=Thermothielavioides terrestris TaxID=2587410 RepID=A0A3S4BBR0_9PEZI|nr:00dc3048-6137-44bc-8c70-daa6954f1df9 [Thermothielavioides terrestris]
MPPRADKGSGAAGKAGEGSGEFAGPFTFNGHIPSTTDLKFIFAFVNHFKVKPEMNWEELTEDLGLKGKKSTYERWRLFRQKFGITLPEESANGPKKVTATTTTPAARGSGNTNDSEDEGAPTVATPAKRSSAKAASTAGTPRTPGSAAGKKRAAAASAAASASSPAGTPTKKVRASAGAGVGGPGSPAAASKGKGGAIPPTPQNNGELSSPLSSPASDDSTTQMAE